MTGRHDAFVRVEMIRALEEQDLDERLLAVMCHRRFKPRRQTVDGGGRHDPAG